MASQLNNKSSQIAALIGMGYGYRLNGDYETSFQKLVEAAELSLTAGNVNLEVIYMEMSNTLFMSGETQKALSYNNRAINLLKEMNNKTEDDTYNLAATLLNTGSNYSDIGQYDTAILYLAESEALFREMEFAIGIGHAVGNKASINFKRGNIDIAAEGFREAVEILRAENDVYGLSNFSIQLGKSYAKLGRPEDAIAILSQNIKLARQAGLADEQEDANKILADIYGQLGQKDLAYDYQSRYLALRDSIDHEELAQKLANQRADFEISLKQAEIDVLEEKRKTERIVLFSSVSLFVVTMVFMLVLYGSYQAKTKLSQELQALNASKDKLFSIVSHDLRGPMQAFKGVALLIRRAVMARKAETLMQMADEVFATADQLSRMLDNLLNWTVREQKEFNVSTERLSVEELMKDISETYRGMAKAKEIELMIESVDEEILADRNMTYTIFRNLVDNAIKFTPEKGKVWIKCERTGDNIMFHVKDSGAGIEDDKIKDLFNFNSKKRSFGTKGEKGLGLGLSLVYDFIAQNEGEIFVKSNKEQGTEFTVKLKAA